MSASEIEVCRPVIAYMKDLGWDVYQEVEGPAGRADIVGSKGRLLWVVEAKTRLSLALLGQCFRWTRYAHYVSVAVPPKTRDEGTHFAMQLLRERGAGLFNSREYPFVGSPTDHVKEVIEAKFHRAVDYKELASRLHVEQMQVGEAGSQHGYWTPFKQTCENLRQYLKGGKRVSLKEAIGSVQHHYKKPSTAVGSMANWIKSGKVPGVKYENGIVWAVS